MKLSELINKQTKWEYDRGIKNVNWGADRIQVELDEVKEEPDLYGKLVEYADVIIITLAGVGAVLTALDMTAEDFEAIIQAKMAINDVKYKMDYFEQMSTEEALAHARNVWVREVIEPIEGNDVY